MSAARHMCVDCRTFLGDLAECDMSPDHVVCTLDTKGGNGQLKRAVWSFRKSRKWLLPLLALIFGPILYCAVVIVAAYYAQTWSVAARAKVMLPLIFAPMLVVAILAFAGVLGKLHFLHLARRIRVGPHGVGSTSLELGKPRHIGTARTKVTRSSPLAKEACLAYSIEARAIDAVGDDVVFRNASSYGFDLIDAEDKVVHIPAGPIRLVARETTRHSGDEVAEHIAELLGDAADLAPADVATESLVRAGDRVTLYTPFVPSQQATGYRDGTWIERAEGTPVIEVIRETAAP